MPGLGNYRAKGSNNPSRQISVNAWNAVIDRLRETVSIKDFGASNSVTASENRAAIQGAVDSGAKRVLIPECDITIDDAIALPADVTIEGAGFASKITTTGTNKRVFYASNADKITVKGVHIVGNWTGEGSISATSAGGEGLAFSNCDYVEVSDCYFDGIGKQDGTGFASSVKLVSCSKIKVSGNFFLGGKSASGADVDFSYYCTDAIITNNFSVSDHDSFISGAAVGDGTLTDTIRHIIAGNIGSRSDGSAARTGILCPYDAEAGFVTIDSNVLDNFPANGIYLSAAANNTADSAGVAITGNIVRYCGGDNSMTGLSAGIYISGRNGTTCAGNLVYKAGYRSDGVARDDAISGIFAVGSTRAAAISGNTVAQARGHGVHLKNISAGTDLGDVAVTGNVLRDNAAGGAFIEASGVTAAIANICFASNLVTQVASDGKGVSIQTSSGATAPKCLTVSDNQFIGKPSGTAYGLDTNCSGIESWRIQGNLFKNYARGINFGSSSIADKEIGYNIVVDGNTFDTCATGVTANIGAAKYALIFNSHFYNCSADVADTGRCLNAVRLGGQIIEARRSAAPTDGAWLVGQRIANTAPAAGGFMGWVCTTAGSPGTWKTYGAINA